MRTLRLSGGFRGRAIEWCQTNSTTTNPCCHGNEIWDKISHNSSCIRDISEILASNSRFWGQAIEYQSNFKTTDPGCHGNEIWDKNSYNSACIECIAEMPAPCRGFSGSGDWMITGNNILPRPNPVAIATKYKTKSPINRLVYEISPKSLRLTVGLLVKLSNGVSRILRRRTVVIMATKIETKTAITQLL